MTRETKFQLVSYVDDKDYYTPDLKPAGDALRMNLDLFHPKKTKKILDKLLEQEDLKNVVLVSAHDTIFNIIGDYIGNGIIKPENVDIILYDAGGKEIKCGYDSDGFLVDGYPPGYFDWYDLDNDDPLYWYNLNSGNPFNRWR